MTTTRRTAAVIGLSLLLALAQGARAGQQAGGAKSTATDGANTQYTIDGDASEVTPKGEALLWRYGAGLDIEKLATARLVAGKFQFKGNIDWVSAAGVAVQALDGSDHSLASADIVLEPGETRIVFHANAAEPEVRGGKYSRQLIEAWQLDPAYRAAVTRGGELMARREENGSNGDRYKRTDEAFRSILEARAIKSKVLLKGEASSDPLERFLALGMRTALDQLNGIHTDSSERQAELVALQKELPGNEAVSRTIARIAELQKRTTEASTIKVGSVISDFTAPDINGREVRLSSVVQQQRYVLIEFWASWCRPCRDEIPNLKKMYTAFHGKGFEIVSFSLDKMETAWRKASNDEKIPWINTSDLKDMNSPIVKLFGVVSVPKSFLVDRRGTIVAEDLRGRDLDQKLSKLL